MLRKLFFLFLFLIILSSCSKTETSDPQMDAFAECLSDSGVKMYGAFTCSVCDQQRRLFGPSFEKIGEIECHPHAENSESELCLEKEIQKTPTWTLERDGEELGRLNGYQTIETLSELSGCVF